LQAQNRPSPARRLIDELPLFPPPREALEVYRLNVLAAHGEKWIRMKKKMKKGRIGASFDAFLREEGMYEEVTALVKSRAKLRQQKEVGAAFAKYRWSGNLAASRRGRGGG